MLNQTPLSNEVYGEDYFAGKNCSSWKYGVSMEAKRRSEGIAPYLTMETFDLWDNKKVLDCGAGRGHLVSFLNEYGANTCGLDFSKYAIDNTVAHGRVILGDMTKLPYNDNSFHLVISRENFEHLTVEQANQAFEEMLRVSNKWIYLTICVDPNSKDEDKVGTDFDRDLTHISYCSRIFWLKRFHYYTDKGLIKRDFEKEKIMDWRGYGRVFVYEKLRDFQQEDKVVW
jgi:SAM-dependent methyltransferase